MKLQRKTNIWQVNLAIIIHNTTAVVSNIILESVIYEVILHGVALTKATTKKT